jgi:hypothetical protein
MLAIFVALPIVAMIVAVPQTAAAEGEAEQEEAAQPVGPAPGESAPEPGPQPAQQVDMEPGESDSPATTTGEAATGAETDSEPEQAREPVTGAFGIPLGKRFEPCMVAEVLGEEERTYRGPDKTERIGTRYRVKPKVPNAHFTAYAVDTTSDGVIYAVGGEHEPEVRENKCAVTKELAAALEAKYGKPRGKGGFGEWYAFRDMSVDHYRGIRLYANRCRRGIYSIVYGDDGVKAAEDIPPAVVEPTATSGL